MPIRPTLTVLTLLAGNGHAAATPSNAARPPMGPEHS